jgi:hypothetical protein
MPTNLPRVHRSPDPKEGGTGSSLPPKTDPVPPVQDPKKAPGATPADAAGTAALPSAAPPPAAVVVLEGGKTEREVALEKKLKERETRAAELEDENRRLKEPPVASNPQTPAAEKKHWLEGSTFFD